MAQLRQAFLTGPAGYTRMLGDGSKTRTRVGRVAALLVWMIPTLANPWPGVIIGTVLALAVMVLTNPSASGDLVGKAAARVRWSTRQRRGTDRFVPYSREAEEAAVKVKGTKARRRALGALRVMPDGCAGMGWLECRPQRVGIAWHQPSNEKLQYLSVAFEVDGRMRGFESQGSLNYATEQWGQFLASLGGDFSLCRSVQVLTRVLPPNSVRHEAWVRANTDPALKDRGELGQALLRSYEDVLRTAVNIGTSQRHFVVVRYDIDSDFESRASKFGKGTAGWQKLMAGEIESMTRRLQHAGVGRARPLTARQVAAMIRHCQDPSRELDRVADIDVCNFGVDSYDTRATYVTKDVVLSTPSEPVRWYSATARIEATHMDAEARNMFWLNDWITNLPEPIVRSMSFHVRVVPARIARDLARQDETMDAAELASKREAGSLATDEAQARRVAAAMRGDDLRPGTGFHGIEWMGFLTVTATTAEELERHTRIMTERAGTNLGIRRLEWCRNFQSTAAGFNWPIARGLSPHRISSVGSWVEGAISRVDQDKELAS